MRGVTGCALALVAALAASLARPHARAPELATEPVWPTELDGRALVREPLTAREERLGAGFAGAIARFGDGERQIVVRWLDGAARGYHGALDCYRGLGFEVRQVPNELDAAGRAWSRFDAARGDERLSIRERVESADGASSWTDPAEWFWSAALGRARGPFRAWLVVERP
ncbi:MAG: hypothetical protein EPO68_13985 [Planctomycetota bacterium]|nr:MAG: hypothetical protein EPO68_13985 [Planctomycetota bacterium]